MPFAVASDGTRTYYEVDGTGPALLLLHGFGSGGARWRDTGYVDALRATHRVIFPDMRGHGRSDRPHEASAYSCEAVIGDALAVLDDVGVDQADVWGYSRGGSVAVWLSAVAPARVTRAIIGGYGPGRRVPPPRPAPTTLRSSKGSRRTSTPSGSPVKRGSTTSRTTRLPSPRLSKAGPPGRTRPCLPARRLSTQGTPIPPTLRRMRWHQTCHRRDSLPFPVRRIPRRSRQARRSFPP